MTKRAASRPPRVIFASPVAQPPSRLHSSRMAGPPARWIAPSTPPPPRSVVLAALTIASVSWRVMSPRTSSSSAAAMVRRATELVGRRRLHRARRLGGPGLGWRGLRGQRRLFLLFARRAATWPPAMGGRGRQVATVVEAVVLVAQLGHGTLVLLADVGLFRLDRRGRHGAPRARLRRDHDGRERQERHHER